VTFSSLLDDVAAEHPSRSRDAALSAAGRHNIYTYARDRPLAYAAMFAGKVWDMWRTGAFPGGPPAMRSPPWVGFHVVVVILALAGLFLLWPGRRPEVFLLAALIGFVSLVGMVLIASPRRTLPLWPELAALAGSGAVIVAERVRARRARG
jgi:hypothetical protein